jgi:hypothetical protein
LLFGTFQNIRIPECSLSFVELAFFKKSITNFREQSYKAMMPKLILNPREPFEKEEENIIEKDDAL